MQPDVEEEEKEKKKKKEKEKKEKEKKEKEVGDRGAPVDRVVPKRRLCEGASRRPEPRRAFHNYVYNFSLPIYKKKF